MPIRRLARWHAVLTLTVAAGLLGCPLPAAMDAGTGSTGVTTSSAGLTAMHQAMIETYLPPDLPPDLAKSWQAFQAQAFTWTMASRDPALVQQLTALQAAWAQGHDGSPFQAQDRTTRERFLHQLHLSESPQARALARALRLQYVGAIYTSPVGDAASGVSLPPRERPDWQAYVQANAPRPPRTTLAYDPGQRTLRQADGQPIDTLVIGSGPAGAMVAHERQRRGERVLVVDAGPLILPGSVDTGGQGGLMANGGHWPNQDGSVLFKTAKALGGGTAVNVDLALPPTLPTVQYQIEQWRQAGRIRADQFQPAEMVRTNEAVEALIGTRTVAQDEINANNAILWQGAQGTGHEPSLYRLNAYLPGHSPYGAVVKRSSTSELLLKDMAVATNPLQVLPDTRVDRLRFETVDGVRRAVGVDAVVTATADTPGRIADPCHIGLPTETPVTIQAKRVVVCAGTIGSAALLLQSDLNLPAIGRGIVGHPSMPLIGVFDRPIRNWEGTTASVYVADRAIRDRYYMEAMSAEPAYAAMMMPGTAAQVFQFVRQYAYLGGFGVMLLDSVDMANRISLDANGRPQILYTMGTADRSRLVAGIADGIRMLFQAGAKQVLLPTTEPVLSGVDSADPTYTFLTDAGQADQVARNLKLIPGRTVITSAHLQGSNKIGQAPTDSVVDPDGKVWGTANLYVMDSSIFPTTVGANPMQTIYAVAKILADRLPDL